MTTKTPATPLAEVAAALNKAAMVKWQPATPLPWDFVNAENAPIPAMLVVDSEHGDVARIRDYGKNRGNAEQNAAYIAHAANAYPRLVEVLARMERQISEICPQASTLSYARALLRELGENA